MDKFFNSDNMVMRTLSKIFDIGWLTLIYLVFCIPIVTVGAATTSLYYVSAKVLRHNRSYVWREFWHSFKTNFLQSTIAWVVTAIIVVLLWLNMNIVAETGGEKGGYLIGAYYALLFIWFGMVTNVVLIFIFAPGAASLLYTFPMEHVMKKYMPKEEKKYTEDGEEIVAWYNE